MGLSSQKDQSQHYIHHFSNINSSSVIANPGHPQALRFFCLRQVLTIQPPLTWMELVDQAHLRLRNWPSSASFSVLELKVDQRAPSNLEFCFADINFEDLHGLQDTARDG